MSEKETYRASLVVSGLEWAVLLFEGPVHECYSAWELVGSLELDFSASPGEAFVSWLEEQSDVLTPEQRGVIIPELRASGGAKVPEPIEEPVALEALLPGRIDKALYKKLAGGFCQGMFVLPIWSWNGRVGAEGKRFYRC